MLIDQLELVAVACEDKHLVALFGCMTSNRAHQIVRFEARLDKRRDAHRLQQLACHRHLRSKLIGRLLTMCLIFGKCFVAEGAFGGVERHHNGCRLDRIQQREQHVGEAEHRIRGAPIGGGQHARGIETPIEQAVPIDHHQDWSRLIPRRHRSRLYSLFCWIEVGWQRGIISANDAE
jgi:hypothetical protein